MARQDEPTRTLRVFGPKEVALDADSKLQLIRARLRTALVRRTDRVKTEASGLQHDMVVCAERIDEDGFEADISSVRVAGYHIAQTELIVLRKVWSMVNSIIGGVDISVDKPGEEESE